jgi:Peptidase family S41
MRQIPLLLPFLLFVFSLNAQNLSVKEAQEDLQYFRKKMDAFCPSIGHYQPKEVYEKAIDSIESSITQPIHYLSFYRKLLPIKNTLQDGHFNIKHHKKFNTNKLNLLPFYPKKVEDRFFVWWDYTVDTLLPKGTEILKINGQEISPIFTLLCSKYRSSIDGPENFGVNQVVQNGFPYYYALWYGSRDSVVLTYKMNDTSQIINRKFACHNAYAQRRIYDSRPKSKDKYHPNLSLEIIDSIPKTAIFYVHSFKMGKRSFREKTKLAFQTAKEKGIENLIIELRNNSGGYVSNCKTMLQYLIKEDFELMANGTIKKRGMWRYSRGLFRIPKVSFFRYNYYDKKNKIWSNRKHKTPQIKPKKTNHYDKNVYFLTNGGTFSAGVALPAIARSHNIGIIVGEPTGGAYLGCFAGKFKVITLPNSKIRVSIPLQKVEYDVLPSKNIGVTLKPTYLVERTIEDVRNNRDVAKAFVFSLIKH